MRRYWLLLAAVFTGCRKPAPAASRLFPETVAGVWRRTAVREIAISDAPDPVSRSGVDRVEAASYKGPGKLGARVYELESPEVGLNLAQRWRPSADTVFFNQGRFFVVIKWQEAERKALAEFVRDFEDRLKETGGGR